MILLGGIILTAIALGLLFINPHVGVLILFAVKPVIDATWESSLFGHNVLELIGAGVPTVFLLRVLVRNDLKNSGLPLFWIWGIYLYTNIFLVFLMLGKGKGIDAFEVFLRTLNGVVGFYLIQTYITDKALFKKLLLALLIAGLFPMLMGLYQAATGTVWRIRQTVGLTRHVGIYHDAVSFRIFIYMTLTGIILYWSYFTERAIIKKLILLGYAVICSVVLFKIYSKAGYTIFVIWFLIWGIFRKQFIIMLAIAVGIIAANYALDNKIFEDVSTVFSKETAAIEGTGETRYIFAGRLTIWDDYWAAWKNAGILNKTFGLGTSAGTAHNDLLRMLVSGGIVGLAAYCTLLLIIGWKVGRNFFQNRTPLNVMAVMIYLMWLVDTIGLVPSLYPAYQWYVWGFIGLALKGVEGLEESRG